MLSVTLHELKKQMKSIKSIIVVFIIFAVTVGVAAGVKKFAAFIDMHSGNDVYTTGLMLTILFAGPLFTLSLSHNIINEEMKSRTIRFIATKTSRTNIIIGKYLSIVIFWFICLLVSLLLIMIFAHQLYFVRGFTLFSFVTYFIGLTILLSILIKNPLVTNLLGIFLSIMFTVVGIWSALSHNILLKIISFITPYHYLFYENTSVFAAVPILISIIFVIISILVMRKRDL